MARHSQDVCGRHAIQPHWKMHRNLSCLWWFYTFHRFLEWIWSQHCDPFVPRLLASPPSPFLAGLHRHGLGKSGCIAASVILPPGKVIVPVVTVAMLFHALLWNVPWIVHERIATEIWQQQRRFNLGSTEALHPNMHGLPDVPLEAGDSTTWTTCESVFGECWLLYFWGSWFILLGFWR